MLSSFLLVGSLWGLTNAYIEQGTKEPLATTELKEFKKPSGLISGVLSDIINLFRNIGFVLPFILN